MTSSRKSKWSSSPPVVGTVNKENDSPSTSLRRQLPFSRKSQQRSPHRDRRSSQNPNCLYFQKVEDSKQEHALRRYKDASEGYRRAKETVKEKCGKESDRELLMDIGHLYRVRLENSDALQRALISETQHLGENVWEMSLRNTWTMEPQIGDLYAKPQALLNPNVQNEIEIIGYPLKKIPSLPTSKDQGVRQFSRQSRWSAYEHFMEKCEKRLAKIVPHKPDFLGFQVVGSKVMPHSARLSNIPEEETPSELKVENAQEPMVEFASSAIQGPSAEMSCTNLLFCGEAGEIVHKTCSLRNTGSTAFFFKWRRKSVDSLLNSYEVKKESDKASCFHNTMGHGTIAPGETTDFIFSFCSRTVGIFVETWMLDLLPKIHLCPLVLRGLAVYNDHNREWRDRFTSELNHRAFSRTINETVDTLLRDAVFKSQWGFKNKPGFIYSQEAFHFMKENLDFEPPLYFYPDVQARFDELASSVQEVISKLKIPHDEIVSCNGSVSSIMTCISNIKDKDHHDRLSIMAANSISSAQIPPHPSSLVCLAMYRTVCKMIHTLADVAENVALVLQKQDESTETDNSNSSEYSDDSDSDSDSKLVNKMNASKNEGKDGDIQPGESCGVMEDGDAEPKSSLMRMIEIPAETMEDVRRVLIDKVLLFDEEMMKAKEALGEVIESKRQVLISKEDVELVDWNAFFLERHKHI